MFELPESQIVAAHQHCTANRSELLASDICACLYCFETFPPSQIESWVEEMGDGLERLPQGKWTAVCPHCPVDAVIGSASGYPVTDSSFLRAMHAHWF